MSSCCGANITNGSSSGSSGSVTADAAFFNTINDTMGGNTTLINGVNPLITDAALSAHIAAHIAHGTTGDIVGTSDSQTLTNKNIAVNNNSIIMDNIIGSPNITDTVTQQMRTTDNVTFGSVSTLGGVFGGTNVQSPTGHFDTINSQAVDNTATINGINPLTTNTNLNAHIAATTAHGTTSAIVGINDSQRLSAKNLAVPSCKLVDNSDATKAVTFNLIAATTGTITTFISGQTANRALNLPDASDTLVARATSDTLTNKTIDSAGNTLTITNSPLSAANVNSLINQDVRTSASPSFTALTTATINGNTNLAINAGNITATMSQPMSLIVNNTSATFSNELRIQNNGTTIIGFGNNNTTNEAFCWAYANVPLKFATNSTERMRIPASGIANDNTATSILGLQGTSLVFKNNVADTSTAQTFTNKNFSDSTTAIVDVSDATKRILFDSAGTTGTSTTITSAQTADRVITLPDATTTLDGINNTATLSNKTLVAPTISSIINSGVLTLPGTTDTIVARNTVETLTNKTLTAPIISTILNTGTLTLPTVTDTIVARTTTDTLTNKTLITPVIASISNSGTLTLPTGSHVMVGQDTVDTLTNKTLVTPIISAILNGGTLTLPTGPQTLVGRSTTDVLTNKTIDSAGNTLTITNSPLSAANVNTLINQDVRTSAAPTFTTSVNVTQSGNTTFAITGLADYAYSGAAGAFFTSAALGDINLRNTDNTKNLNLGVGSGTAQMSINNTSINYTQLVNSFVGATKIHTSTPVTLSQAAGATTTLLAIPIPTNSSAAIYIYLSLRKITGTIQGYSSYNTDIKCVNLAGTLTQTSGTNTAVSQTAIAGAYAGKATLSFAVAGTTLNINVANTFVDGTSVWSGEIYTIWS